VLLERLTDDEVQYLIHFDWSRLTTSDVCSDSVLKRAIRSLLPTGAITRASSARRGLQSVLNWT
jgi:hypothetical protein